MPLACLSQNLFFRRWYTYIAAIFTKTCIFFGIPPCADVITLFSLQPHNFPKTCLQQEHLRDHSYFLNGLWQSSNHTQLIPISLHNRALNSHSFNHWHTTITIQTKLETQIFFMAKFTSGQSTLVANPQQDIPRHPCQCLPQIFTHHV